MRDKRTPKDVCGEANSFSYSFEKKLLSIRTARAIRSKKKLLTFRATEAICSKINFLLSFHPKTILSLATRAK